MIKAAFFDIDGTLLSFETHEMPASTKAALIALREHGVRCYIATGRSRYQLPAQVTEGFEGFLGFDGFVTMSGSVCYGGEGEVLFDCPIDPADVRTVVDAVKAGRYEVLVMGADRSFVTAHTPEVLATERAASLHYTEGDIDDALSMPVYQFCAFVPPEREHEVSDVCPGVVTTRWCDHFCDVVPAASGKPQGIKALLAHEGLRMEDAIAFGDGGNDATMLASVGVGVAMGNAVDEAKACADYITTDVDADGIYIACKHFGLL